MLNIFPNDIASRIDYLFRTMVLAEEVISEYKAKYPERADEIDAMFRKLLPPVTFRQQYVSDVITQAYFREKIDRLLAQDQDTPTDVEILVLFSTLSTEAKLSPSISVAMWDLLEQIAPGASGVERPYEETPGQAKQAIELARDYLRKSNNATD